VPFDNAVWLNLFLRVMYFKAITGMNAGCCFRCRGFRNSCL